MPTEKLISTNEIENKRKGKRDKKKLSVIFKNDFSSMHLSYRYWTYRYTTSALPISFFPLSSSFIWTFFWHVFNDADLYIRVMRAQNTLCNVRKLFFFSFGIFDIILIADREKACFNGGFLCCFCFCATLSSRN